MKSAEQIMLEAQIAAGADAPPEDATVEVHRVPRPVAVEKLRQLEDKVDRLADKILQYEREGRTKRARRAYAFAVRLQAEANDIREALENGSIVREVGGVE